jgi:spermidine/putrescine transport system substrate-binding protein
MNKANLNRRHLLAMTGGAALGMVPFSTRQVAAQSSPLNVFTWAGYEDPLLRPGYDSLHPTPQFSFFASQTEARTKLTSGFSADISMPTNEVIEQWLDQKLFRPMDESKLKNLADVMEPLRKVESFIPGGSRYLVPTCFGSNGFLYREDKVKWEGEETWEMLFDPQFAGRVSIPDSAIDIVPPVALLLGHKNYWELDAAKLDEVFAKIDTIKPNLRIISSGSSMLEQAIASGEVLIAVGLNENYVRLKAQGIPVKWANPKEGIFTWIEGVGILSSSKASDAAIYDYINAYTSPEAGARLMEAFGFGAANKKSYDLLKPERLAELGLNDSVGMLERTNLMRTPSGEYGDELNRRWAAFKAK